MIRCNSCVHGFLLQIQEVADAFLNGMERLLIAVFDVDAAYSETEAAPIQYLQSLDTNKIDN